MRVLSLFDGISCAFVALQRAGVPITSYHASEICPHAITISKLQHPSIVHLGDVKTVKDQPCDLLIGGSPCQDLSVAKQGREGLAGERSGLFYEFVRIWKESKPRYFLLENVASMKKVDRDAITAVMDVAPIMIDASLVSAQSRKRLFWTNIPVKSQPSDRGLTLKDILQPEVDPKYFTTAKWVPTEEGKRVVGHVNGNTAQANRIYDTNGKSPTLSALGGGLGGKTGLYAIGRDIGRRLDEHGTRKDADNTIEYQRRIETRSDGKSGTLTSVTKDNLVVSPTAVRRLTPVECERLQGLPDGYTEGISDTQRYKCVGNGFNVDVVAHILRHILPGADASP